MCAKAILSAREVLGCVFWDAKGILLLHYLPKGETVTGEYYVNLLQQLVQDVQAKSARLAKIK